MRPMALGESMVSSVRVGRVRRVRGEEERRLCKSMPTSEKGSQLWLPLKIEAWEGVLTVCR